MRRMCSICKMTDFFMCIDFIKIKLRIVYKRALLFIRIFFCGLAD